MGKLRNIGTKLQRYGREFHSAWRIFGPRVAALGVMAHTTGLGADRYYADLTQATWNLLVKQHVPADLTVPQESSRDCGHAPIWTMWWQGIDERTPGIVRACVNSIREHADGHPVHVVSRHNLRDYVTLDPSVTEAFERGEISAALFSDVVRFALLRTHGGAWIDSTIYVTADIPEHVFAGPFYSIPVHRTNPTRNWTSYFIAGVQHNPLFTIMEHSLVGMVKLGKGLPDYFMIDVMLSAIYTHCPEFARMIDAVPDNNEGRFALSEQMDSTAATPDIPAGTYLNKLTYKIDYPTHVHGRPTLYSRVLNNEF